MFARKHNNQLLDNESLMNYCAKVVGLKVVLDNGADLHQNLIAEAVEGNYELAVACLISLDACEKRLI